MQGKNTTSVIFSSQLSQLMKTKGLTQLQLANAQGVSQAAISKWLKGSIPSGDQLLVLANYLNVPMEWLLTGEGPRPATPAPPGGGNLKEARTEAARLARLLGEAEASSARLRSFLG